MYLEIVLAVVTLLVLLIASYSDLRTREVPDLLSYGFIFAIFGVRTLFSLESGWNVFIPGIIGLVAAFIISSIFYYSHQWGGADSKLLIGMGLVVGITFPFTSDSLSLLIYFLALLILGAIYALFWMGYQAFMDGPLFFKNVKKELNTKAKIHYFSLSITFIFLIITFFLPTFWPFIPFPVGLFYLLVFVGVVEKNNFLKHIPLSHLTEGDWLAEPIIYKGKNLVDSRTLSKEDLSLLNSYKGKIKMVKVKEGIPFIPSFLLAYIFLLLGKKLIPFLIGLF